MRVRYLSGMLAGLLFLGAAGLGTPAAAAQFGFGRRNQPQPRRRGMTTGQKVLLIAGAAALFYLYNKHKNASAQAKGAEGRYYRSKNGRIYYRDAKGNPVWVTAPQQPIQVTPEEYQRVTGRAPGPMNGGVLRQAPSGF
jgi:hypothetical protein